MRRYLFGKTFSGIGRFGALGSIALMVGCRIMLVAGRLARKLRNERQHGGLLTIAILLAAQEGGAVGVSSLAVECSMSYKN